MSKNRTPPDVFRSWLAELVYRGNEGDRIPTEHEMAAQFGISRNTVHLAVVEFARQGLVTRVRGKGTIIGGEQVAPPAVLAQRKKHSWEEVSSWVMERVARGKIKVGQPLPSSKETMLRFSVSPATVTTAYRDLEKRGVVKKVGKRYWVARLDSDQLMSAHREVVCIEWSSFLMNSHRAPDQLPRAYDAMEKELLRYGFRIRHYPKEDFAEICTAAQRERKMPGGFVMLNVWDDAQYRHIVTLIRSLAKALHYPVPRTLFLTNRLSTTTRALSFLHHGAYSTATARLCAEYCYQNGITEVVVFLENPRESLGAYVKIWTELDTLNPSGKFRIVVLKGGDIAGEIGGGKRLIPERVTRVISKYRHISEEELRNAISIANSLDESLNAPAGKCLWIFPEDNLAEQGFLWAQEREIPMPHRLSIVSLTNSAALQRLGVSVCTPDWEDSGYLMAHTVIGDIAIGKSRKGGIRVKALLRHRQTTQ